MKIGLFYKSISSPDVVELFLICYDPDILTDGLASWGALLAAASSAYSQASGLSSDFPGSSQNIDLIDLSGRVPPSIRRGVSFPVYGRPASVPFGQVLYDTWETSSELRFCDGRVDVLKLMSFTPLYDLACSGVLAYGYSLLYSMSEPAAVRVPDDIREGLNGQYFEPFPLANGLSCGVPNQGYFPPVTRFKIYTYFCQGAYPHHPYLSCFRLSFGWCYPPPAPVSQVVPHVHDLRVLTCPYAGCVTGQKIVMLPVEGGFYDIHIQDDTTVSGNSIWGLPLPYPESGLITETQYTGRRDDFFPHYGFPPLWIWPRSGRKGKKKRLPPLLPVLLRHEGGGGVFPAGKGGALLSINEKLLSINGGLHLRLLKGRG